MNDDRIEDLAQVTLAASRKLVGQNFVWSNPGGQNVVLRLVAAEPVRRDPSVTIETDRPFSLVFCGPVEQILSQGMHNLDHPDQALTGIFLVPVGDAGEGPQYEAVFS